MPFQPLYWHWLILGMLLMLAEIFIPSFTIFWFGLSAVVIGVILFVAPAFPIAAQLFLWGVLSAVFAILWFRFFKPMMIDKTKAGVARTAIIGETGMVILAPHEKRLGRVRFATPLLGSDEWSFRCSDPVVQGDRVVVQEIAGNTLIVTKTS